jgi:cathepsin X
VYGYVHRYCGSCWAHAVSSALSDRIKLVRKRAFPDVTLSPQVLVNCVTANQTQGCQGGDPTAGTLLSSIHYFYQLLPPLCQ